MGSRGQSYKRQLSQLDRASEKYNSLQERADSIHGVGGRFYDRTGKEVSREDVEKLDEDLKKAQERFEDLRDRMIEREERRNAGRQQEQPATIDDGDILFSQFAEQTPANTAAGKAAARAAKRQATRDRQAKNARMTAGDWIKNQVNVDIEKYRDNATKQFDKRGLITVDWKRMPRAERAYIEQLATKYPNRIQLFDAGAWAKQIRFKK